MSDTTSPTSPTFQTAPDLPAIPLDVGDVAGIQGRIKFKHEKQEGGPRDASWMDKERAQLQAYEYLCHIGEAKEWIEACIKQEIAPIDQLEEELRNGIVLAHLSKFFQPEAVKKIYGDRTRLHWKHSDNVNYFFEACKRVGLPELFLFELTDLYDKKNIPKVIYCIHALSHLLSIKGLAPSMKNLFGQLQFTDEQLDATKLSLEEAGVAMPAFRNVGDALNRELGGPAELNPQELRDQLFTDNIDQVIKCQALTRGYITRRRYVQDLEAYRRQQAELARQREDQRVRDIVHAQATIRMHLQRKKYLQRLQRYKDSEAAITRLQATWKARQAQRAYKKYNEAIRDKHEAWAKLQAMYRAKIQRREYVDRLKYLKSQDDAVSKIQSAWRAKKMAESYKALSRLDSPNVKVLHNFMDVLEDTDIDFEEDSELERLRQLVVKRIRENITTESEVNDLDVKISLLVRNRITLEEVVHYTSKKMRAALSNTQVMEKNQGMLNLNGRDKESREKRIHYEELFYLLQTQPHYLAKLIFAMNRSGGNVTKFLTRVVLSLYGYAQDKRVESLLLGLFKEAIKLEVDDISSLEEFWRADPIFIKLVVDYTRRGGNAEYLRNLVQPIIKEVVNDRNLNLETDPLMIYRTLIAAEESQTGKKSSRPYEVTWKQAAEDPEVRKTQAERMAKVRDLCERLRTAISASAKTMPYGLRLIARELRDALHKRFPGNDDEIVRQVGANFMYYRYINPAIIQPEQFEVIEIAVASALTPMQRKNLAEVGKTLHQICVGKLYSSEDEVMSSLNPFITDSAKVFMSFFKEASTVDPEMEDEYVEAMNEYASMAQKQRPTVKLSPGEIFQLHASLQENLEDVAADKKDNLREIIADLQPVPPIVSGSDGVEVELRLRNRYPTLEDERAARLKLLWNEGKRYIAAVLRIQSGQNLLDMLEAPVTEAEEVAFQELVVREQQQVEVKRDIERAHREEFQSMNNLALTPNSAMGSRDLSSSMNNLTRLSSVSRKFGSAADLLRGPDGNGANFFNLKRRALETMAKLEEEGQLTKANKYQDMLNAIAKDMLTKSRRRSRRRKELESLRNTLKNLNEKSRYLEDQKKSYHDYIDACMSQLQNKKHKGRKPLPFTRQYHHLRELQKAGTVPKFGSYKYSAADLHRKGVLISIEDVNPKLYNVVTMTISSNEAGVFNVEASTIGVNEKYELRLEELLAAQYNNESVITLGEMAKAKINLNLLIFLLNKKFYG
ncbi:hypothetical protein HDU85_002875 [Gaertneriomyces sp. JEL0708]|nr:hypothetical protein HDU85_002875 [Gaertneriomyces sp. JEL0708]